MSNQSTVKCPNCKHEFPIGNALAQEIENEIRSKYLKVYNDDKQKLELERVQINKLIEQTKSDAENQEKIIAEKIKLQKAILEQEATKKAAEEVDTRVKLMEKELQEKTAKIKEAQVKELELMQKEKAFLEKQELFAIEFEKQILEREKAIEERFKQKEAEKTDFKVKELEKKLADQKSLIETMQRKAEQGSMQMQGEVQELALEELLRHTFPFDMIEEVGKGVKGADAIQTVRNPLGKECGKIIYESKNTKAFGGDWIDKLKHDMRSSQADIAVIVTETMPKDMDRFGMKDGVWICNFTEIKSLAFVLRDSLVKIYAAQASQENKGDKMSMLYSYLTGTEFRQQIEAIVEGFTELQMGIQREKNSMQKIWKEREKQLEKVLLNTTNFYGSVKGIAGNAIGDIKLLELGGSEE